jgi:hemerythrin superfamily protein
MPSIRPESGAQPRGGATSVDAIALLESDHRQVEEWFDAFEESEDDDEKQELAKNICTALKVHTQIEEEIFYPACREAGVDDETLDEAKVEHDGAKKLIAEIEAGGPNDELWDSKVKVLSEMIEHHVEEEEEEDDGMFAQARELELDLNDLGARMQARKDELMRGAT